MSAYREAARTSEPEVTKVVRSRRTAIVVALSALGHGLALGAFALAAHNAPAPEGPRRVEVMSFHAAPAPGGAEIEWRGEGGRREALVRAAPR